MVRIGSFIFPPKTTSVQLEMIEAKSKVRKQYRIQSLIRQKTPDQLRQTLEDFQSALEAFDRNENELSLHPGRYHHGRRRHLQIVPGPCQTIAFIDLTLLTSDRYERSLILHQHSMNTSYGQALFSLFQLGNWKAPLHAHIQTNASISSLRFQFDRLYTLAAEIDAGSTILIDPDLRKTTVNETPIQTSSDTEYPYLLPGSNQVIIQVEPKSASLFCQLHYRDRWV